MRVFRQSPVARRVAISLIAILALLLHGLVAAPATALSSAGTIVCVQDGSTPDSSGDHHGHLGLCCILACVVCGTAYVASVAGIAVFPDLPASRVAFSTAPVLAPSAPLEFYFAARGPPHDL